MTRYILPLLLATVLSACSHWPDPTRTEPVLKRNDVRHFAVDTRFALKFVADDGQQTSSGGRLHWTHHGEHDRILLANPLGIGLAEIERQPGLVELRTGDGKTHTADAIAPLISELTGQSWPIDRLPNWLLGRPGPTGKLSLDAHLRPQTLAEDNWRIEYFYDDEAPDALPTRLNAYGENAELRLRIETWKTAP